MGRVVILAALVSLKYLLRHFSHSTFQLTSHRLILLASAGTVNAGPDDADGSIRFRSRLLAKYVEAEALAVLAEEFEVRTAVVINEENILTVVAALNNVVRLTRNDDSGHARHADNLPLAGRKVNK